MNKITVNFNGVGYTELIIGAITSHVESVVSLELKVQKIIKYKKIPP